MKPHKLNILYLICFLFLFLVLLLAGRVIYMLAQGQVSDENGPMSLSMRILMILLILLPISSYLYSFLVMLKHYIVHKGHAFTLTARGVENTLTFINVFAFVFVFPVKAIPWEAVKALDFKNGSYTAAINTKLVKACFAAKAILWIRGYSFCHKFVSPRISPEEINLYRPAAADVPFL